MSTVAVTLGFIKGCILVWIFALVFAAPIVGTGAERESGTPPADAGKNTEVKPKARAEGAEIIINQVETSAYPKVTVYATVLRNGQPVSGLSVDDFQIREEERPQKALQVTPKLGSLTVGLALDTSGSMHSALPLAVAAARNFLQNLQPTDKVQIDCFATTVLTPYPLSSNRHLAEAALSGLNARGGTALYDATFHSLTSVQTESGRKAVIVLSDGVDETAGGKPQGSAHKLEEVLSLARKTNVPVYTIGLGNINQKVLREIATESGGRFYVAPAASDLKDLYEGIRGELEGQYSITFKSDLPSQKTERVVELTYTGRDASVTDSKPYIPERPPSPAPVLGELPTRGGTSFATALALIPGQRYRLAEHLQPGEFAYFQLDAAEDKLIYATIHAGQVGVTFDKEGRPKSDQNTRPHVGLAVANADELEIYYKETSGPGAGYYYIQVPTFGELSRYYILVGCKTAAVAKGVTFQVELGGVNGVGFDVVQTAKGFFVEKLRSRSPAEKAGVKVGDQILKIDEFEVGPKTVGISVLSRINTDYTSAVKFSIRRPATKEEVTIAVTPEEE